MGPYRAGSHRHVHRVVHAFLRREIVRRPHNLPRVVAHDHPGHSLGQYSAALSAHRPVEGIVRRGGIGARHRSAPDQEQKESAQGHG